MFDRPSGQRTEKFYDIFSRNSGKIHGQVKLGVMWTSAAEIYAEPEPPPAPAPAPAYQAPAPAPAYQPPAPAPQNPDEIRGWYYVDPSGATQGPHSAIEMRGWASFFQQTVQVMAPGVQGWQPLSSYPQIGGKPIVTPPRPAPAPARAAPQLLQITCPQGVFPGQTIHTRTPAGVTLAVTVPAGIMPGMLFNIQC